MSKAGRVDCGIMWCDCQATPPRYFMGLVITKNNKSKPYCTVEITCDQWHAWDEDGKGLRAALNKIKKLAPKSGSTIKCPI